MEKINLNYRAIKITSIEQSKHVKKYLKANGVNLNDYSLDRIGKYYHIRDNTVHGYPESIKHGYTELILPADLTDLSELEGVEMLVWHSNKVKYKRKVIGRFGNDYIAISTTSPKFLVTWPYVEPIPVEEPLVLTMEDVAKLAGVSVDKIIIKV